MLRKRLTAIGVLTLVGALVLAPSSEAATAARTYLYVAADFYVAGPDVVADTLRDSTDPGTPALAPVGTIKVVPVRDRLTLLIDDAGDIGRIHVTVSRLGHRRDLCVMDGMPKAIRGLRIGAPTTITIWGATHLDDRCGAGTARATAGAATVTL